MKVKKTQIKKSRSVRRKEHVRKTIFGTPERLRLTVFKSLNNINAQLIDDSEGKTVVSASTLESDIAEQIKPEMKKLEQSQFVGKKLAEKALERGYKKAAFDRNGYIYHGRVKALADAARKAGLEF